VTSREAADVNATDDFVRAVEQHTGRQGRRNGKNVRLYCPAHDDRHPSLDVAEGDNGRPLVVCRSHGCSYEAICDAIGWERTSAAWEPEAIYSYSDEQGVGLFEVGRFPGKRFLQRRAGASDWKGGIGGVRRVLYRQPKVVAAVEAGEAIYVVEGEKDVHALERAGIVATCNPMGAGKWRDEYADSLARAELVVVLPDDDDEGRRHAEQVARSLVGRVAEVKVVALWPTGQTKRDVSDWIAEQTDDVDVLLDVLVADTPAYEPTPATSSATTKAGALGEPSSPFALTLDEFIATKSDLPPALLGDDVETILAAVGFLLLFGRGGRGKTTLSVDAVLHLASGIDWLGFHVERPLRILVIENEGPRELFRDKLERKRSHWPHPIAGAIFVYTENWGAFTLSDPQAIERLRAFIAQNQVDLVIGDPLDTLGVAGVGSPDEIRTFVALMVEAGLSRDVAFWLLHHPRKERTDDELDEAAGAWGGKPDTVLRIDVQPGDRARLSFPKVRWSRRSRRPALILAFDPETEGYSVVGEEGEERDLAAEIEELLADGVWRIVKEVAAPKDADKPGVGANADSVKTTLEGNPERFESRTGDEAVALGRRANATVWQKQTRGPESVESEHVLPGGKGRNGLRPPSSIEDEVRESDLSPAQTDSGFSESVDSVAVGEDDTEVERLADLARELNGETIDAREGS
jgi:5S rRNA maturation endonuclease (ribonuclease M5)